MERFIIAQSSLKDAVAAVNSIREQLSDIEASMILYFASPVYPPETSSTEMANAFANVRTVGCTTAGEMITGKMGRDSIVAMAWHKDTLKYLQIEVLENIQTDTDAVEKAFKSFEKSLGKPMDSLDPALYAGMVIIDGLSGCEEQLNDQLGNLTNVPFVGGSAGDNLAFKQTCLFVDGKVYSNAAILLLMEPENGYAILKTQSFTVTDKKLTPTKVDEKRRMIIEFNGKPATEAYAEALGITIDKLSNNLDNYPFGLVFDEDNFFVRSPQRIEGTSVICYCSVKEGLELSILQAGDIVADTRTDLQNCGKIQAVVDFNCIQRFLVLSYNNQLKEYSEIFGDVPAIGFATYGESYIGHINQTSTMLLLK
jgi:hypothetical protein